MPESFEDILNEPDEVETEAVADTPVVEDQTTEEALAAAEPVEEVTQPEAPEGYKQDARGVWHRPDGTIATRDEVSKFGAKAEQAAPIVGDTAQPELQPPPFTFKSQGQEIPLEGASLDKDGNLVVSKSSLATLLPMLARAQEFPAAQSREARTTSELQETKRTYREALGRAEAAEVAYNTVAAILDDPDRLVALASDPRELQFALREIQLGIQKSQLTRQGAERDEQVRAQTTEQSVAQESETITNAIQLVAQSPDMRDLAAFLTPQDLSEATEYFKEMRAAIVRTAEDDSLAQYGVNRGEKYVTHAPMQQYLKRIATERKAGKEALAAATKAGKFNASQNPRVTAPPLKRPVTAAVPSAPKEKDWDSSFKDAWNADPDDE